jgi:predicted ATPase
MIWNVKSETIVMLKYMFKDTNKLYNDYQNKYDILQTSSYNKKTDEYYQKMRYYKENIERNKTNYWKAKLELIMRNKIKVKPFT